MSWLTTAVSTSVPWPQSELHITFEGVEIDILPETEESMPSVRINLHDHSMDLEQGRALLRRFFSSLSWSKNGYIREISTIRSSGKIPIIGKNVDTSIITSRFDDDYIPVASNDEQRLALALYREAQYLNSTPYKYLAYFKILNIKNRSAKEQKVWINDNLSRLRNHGNLSLLEKLQTTESDIGSYLYSSGRCALAHAYDKDNLVNPDDSADLIRISEELGFIKELAEIFIELELGIKSRRTFYSEHLYELEGIKKIIPSNVVNALKTRTGVEIDGLTFPNLSVGEQRSNTLETFRNMKVVGKRINACELELQLLDQNANLRIFIAFDFKNERLKWDLFNSVLISSTPSAKRCEALIDLSKLRIQMLKNGRFAIYDSEDNSLLGRTDEFIPVNIDLGKSINNIEQEILNLKRELKSFAC